MPSATPLQDHYAILSLPHPPPTTSTTLPNDQATTTTTIKLAYRRALLLHHPDKSSPSPSPTQTPHPPKPTIDQITLAYKTLTSPPTRDDPTRQLPPPQPKPSHPGLETVDLDDMAYDEGLGVWYRGCRCGRERGYSVSEAELEMWAAEGEVLAGCAGCSLWVRVGFAVVGEGC